MWWSWFPCVRWAPLLWLSQFSGRQTCLKLSPFLSLPQAAGEAGGGERREVRGEEKKVSAFKPGTVKGRQTHAGSVLFRRSVSHQFHSQTGQWCENCNKFLLQSQISRESNIRLENVALKGKRDTKSAPTVMRNKILQTHAATTVSSQRATATKMPAASRRRRRIGHSRNERPTRPRREACL